MKRYILFTNLQLGLKTESRTKGNAILSKDRSVIKAAIQKGNRKRVRIEIFDAAQLAALVNKHPALRLTFFSPSVARPWEEKWAEENASKNYKPSAPLVGRDNELHQLAVWIADITTKVIAICGPNGMGKTRLALECTRGNAIRTTVVDIVAELERIGVNALTTSAQTRIVIVEDPTEEQALRLARQAVNSTGVKLIFTFPSERKTTAEKLQR